MTQSLCGQLRTNKLLETDIGTFTFKAQIGSGGNSTVFLFERNYTEYAIKFLTITDDERKEKRFVDEYFALAQIPSHANILPQYHFDKVKINEQWYYIIISKKFQFSLKAYQRAKLNEITDNENKLKIIERIFFLTCEGIKHLHLNGIIHRDLKPENIYLNLDEDGNIIELVIGDFGIAHFDENYFDKLSETREGERLANYKFSAPEQSEYGKTATYSSDIFALGQIMQWVISGTTHHGTDRNKICPNHPFFDAIIDKCLKNDETQRYQSINEIMESIKSISVDRKRQQEQALYKKLVWDAIYDLDEIIRQTCTQITDIETIDNPTLISEFLSNFNRINKGNNFWCMASTGSDSHAPKWIKQEENIWLMDTWNIECSIDKIYIYRDDSIRKNFFIIQTTPLSLFQYEAIDGTIIPRDNLDDYQDYAYFFQGKCISPNETKNGFYRDNSGESHKLTQDNHYFRNRIIKKMAFMIAPIDTPVNIAPEYIIEEFMENILNSDDLNIDLVDDFNNKTRNNYSNT